VEGDDHFYQVTRYVERNALRANLVRRAQDWRWGSLWRRLHGGPETLLAPWPLPEPPDWCGQVNRAQTNAEVEAIRRSVMRGQPYGSASWVQRTAKRLGLESTLRNRGRPPLGEKTGHAAN
jgi:putative transposase